VIRESKPTIFNGDLAHLPAALHWLTTQKRWVVWRWVRRVNKKSGVAKWTKPPFEPAYPANAAKSNDPTTWGSYDAALATVAADKADGIGVMLLDGELAAVDLDQCRDPVTHQLTSWARHLCVEAEQHGLYREVTVSGRGLRFIGVSQGAEMHRRFPFHRTSGEGLELYRKCARFITISGLQEGQCETMGDIDAYLDVLLARHTIGSPLPQATSQLDLNSASPQRSEYFRDLIENGAPEGERSERFSEVVWHLAGAGMSIDEIVEELAKHPSGIGAKYAKRLRAEVARCHNKWQSRRLTAVTGIAVAAAAPGSAPGSAPAGAAANLPAWPQIRVIPSELPRVVNEAEDALLAFDEELFQRGGLLVRPVTGTIVNVDGKTEGWQLIQLTRPYLVETLCRAAQFMRIDGRSKAWAAIDAPDKVALALLSRRGKWKLPVLSGIVQAPFLRLDGSLCETAGYDPESKLLFKTDQSFPPIPQQPSRDDALKAIGVLEALIQTFPFINSADRSVALGAMLSTLDRRSMATAPLFAFNSPSAGTGKSKLVDLCSILATGDRMPVISQGWSQEEFVKCLSAALLAGDLGISIDNCERELNSDFLCQVLTQPKLNIRVLGLSTNIETPMNAMLFATGNNLVFGGDVIRRSLMCSMDAGCERPELRTFKTDVVNEARQRRGELVVAALTVLRAWHVAGECIDLPAFGGFEDWSHRVREVLVWLGRADPCETLAEVRESDPNRGELITVIEQWKHRLVQDQPYTVQQVIGRALTDADFHNALLAVAMATTGGMTNNVRLGRWLKRVKGRVVNGFKLVEGGNNHGYPLWKLVRN
jgi:hypothetical protein